MPKKLDNLSVLMTTVTTNDPGYPPRYILLRIVDETSGQQVAEVEIMPDQLINFLGNGQAKAAGWVNEHVERLGRAHRWTTYKIEGIPGWGEQPEHPDVLATIERAKSEGWETWDYRFSHGKHTLVCRRWVDEDAPDEG